MTTDLERVRRLVDWLVFERIAENKRNLADKLGYTESSLSQILNGKVSLSNKFIKKLANINSNINEDWLTTGEGEMLKTEQPNSEQQDDQCDCPMHSLADSVAKIAESVTLLAKGNIELIQQQSKLIEMLYSMKTKE